jgi:hypothetical protein
MTPQELWGEWLPLVKAEREMIQSSPYRNQLHQERRSLVYRSMDMVLSAICHVQQNKRGTTRQAIREIEKTMYQSMLDAARSARNEDVRRANIIGAAVARLAIKKLRGTT